MVRSLYSAASGMIAQQTNVDVIANNLANVNSTGYKAESASFKSLLYQDLQAKCPGGPGFKNFSSYISLYPGVS